MKRNEPLVFLAFFVVGIMTIGAPLSAEEVRVGVILPLSGEGAPIGEACKNGVTLALQDLPADERDRLKILYEDDQLLAKNTVAAYNKIQATTGMDVTITVSSGTSKAISPLADESATPLIAVASDPSVVAGREQVFNLWVTPENEVTLLLQRLKQLGLKRIAVVSALQDGVAAIIQSFHAQRGSELQVVMEERFAIDQRDFRPFITKLKHQDSVDVIFVELFFGQTGIFARQLREAGINLPLVNIESFEDVNDVKLSNGSLVGQWYIQADEPSGEFLTRYQEAFPDSSHYTAANCHDAIGLITAALKQSNDPPSKAITHFLHTVKDFHGALGTFSATDDNRFDLPAAVKIVTKDGFKKLRS